MLDSVEVARAALCEAGRPDLAEGVERGDDGQPGHEIVAGRESDDRTLLLRAFVIAHQSHDPEAHIITIGTGTLGWLCCPTCWHQESCPTHARPRR